MELCEENCKSETRELSEAFPTPILNSCSGNLEKVILIDLNVIINLKHISHIYDTNCNIVCGSRIVKIVMNDGFCHEILCNNQEESQTLMGEITYNLLYENDKNILEITSNFKNTHIDE
jgi:hypothetical protein